MQSEEITTITMIEDIETTTTIAKRAADITAADARPGEIGARRFVFFRHQGLWLSFVIKSMSCILALVPLELTQGQAVQDSSTHVGYGKPAVLAADDLEEFNCLPEDRRALITEAIHVAKELPWLPYTARGAAPSDGGFDCSGAMHFVLRRVGLDPPRTSGAQLEWLRKAHRLQDVPLGVVSMSHASMGQLRPGDLLFWGRLGSADSGVVEEVTHVAMFLGHEKRDKRPVMINSTDGRSYRGVKANGYGVYDFRLPSVGSTICFLGYGSPPGIAKTPVR